MWTIEQLREKDIPLANFADYWVPARPENYKKQNMSIRRRLRHAYAVFSGKAEAFTWPMGQ